MKNRPIFTFLSLTLLISSIFYFLIIRSGHMGGGWGGYVAGLMWSSGLAALLTCRLLGRDLRTIGWSRGSGRYELIGYLIPLAYSIVIYGFVLYFVLTATFAVIRDTATVIGEEIGWRGFLVPELAKTQSFARTAALTGFIWAIWHYPIVLFADYKSDTPVWFYLPLLTIMLPFLTFVWTWLRLKSGSIWPCVIARFSQHIHSFVLRPSHCAH